MMDFGRAGRDDAPPPSAMDTSADGVGPADPMDARAAREKARQERELEERGRERKRAGESKMNVDARVFVQGSTAHPLAPSPVVPLSSPSQAAAAARRGRAPPARRHSRTQCQWTSAGLERRRERRRARAAVRRGARDCTEHGGVACVEQRALCARRSCVGEGGCNARRQLCGSGPRRYKYECRVCAKHFDQLRPDQLDDGEDREARWCAAPGSRQPAPPTEPATQQQQAKKRHVPGGLQPQREWLLRQGQHQAEVRIGFHNARGQKEKGPRDEWVNRLLDRFDLVGACEMNSDEIMQSDMEKMESVRQGGYRVWFAHGNGKQNGIALIVSNRLAGMKVEVVHRDPAGRAHCQNEHTR